jgi:hypothetical protein
VDRFSKYLFAQHDQATIRKWAVSLSYFRFCRAYGGHANDGDRFLAALAYMDELDFLAILETLGLTPNTLPPQPAITQPAITQPDQHFPEAIENFKFRVKDLPHLEQIGFCQIDDAPCFLWASLGIMTLTVAGAEGNSYEVTEKDFQQAKRIETRLHVHANWIIDPPQDDRNCVCPKYYAGYWQTHT